MTPTLAFSTRQPAIDVLIQGSLGLVETIFPDRIRAFYLTGSYSEGTAVAVSDLDIVVVFKGEFAEGEADRLRQTRRYASHISPIHLDLVPKCEAALKRKGASSLKLAGKFLYGEDILADIPFEPIEIYRHDVIQGLVYYTRELRGLPDRLALPLQYPKAAGPFFGYARFGIWQAGSAYKPGTRLLINAFTLGATASIVLAKGERAGSKLTAVRKYGELIGDKWGVWLNELYSTCKEQGAYLVPEAEAGRLRLRQLLRQAPDYENVIFDRCRPFLFEHEQIIT